MGGIKPIEIGDVPSRHLMPGGCVIRMHDRLYLCWHPTTVLSLISPWNYMLRALAALPIVLFSQDAAAQSASPINPSTRPLGYDDQSSTRPYRVPDYSPIYDGRGNRIGTLERNYGPLGTDYTVRDRRFNPVLRVPSQK